MRAGFRQPYQHGATVHRRLSGHRPRGKHLIRSSPNSPRPAASPGIRVHPCNPCYPWSPHPLHACGDKSARRGRHALPRPSALPPSGLSSSSLASCSLGSCVSRLASRALRLAPCVFLSVKNKLEFCACQRRRKFHTREVLSGCLSILEWREPQVPETVAHTPINTATDNSIK